MNIKQLREFLATLPDDTKVIQIEHLKQFGLAIMVDTVQKPIEFAANKDSLNMTNKELVC